MKKFMRMRKCFFFNDINPIAKIHVLGIPKTPSTDFSDFILKNDPEKIAEFYKKINMIVEKLEIRDSGYKIITNSGDNGGQEVPHFHVHI